MASCGSTPAARGSSAGHIVARPIQIGGHGRDRVEAILAAVCPAQLDAGDFGDRIGLVGRLQRAGQQVLFAHRLRAVARINAGEPRNIRLTPRRHGRRRRSLGLDHQVLAEEIGRKGVVRVDAADLGRRQEYDIRALRCAKNARIAPGRSGRARRACA